MIRAMYDHAEGTLAYDCPETRREVFTAILTDEGTLKRLGTLKLSVWCPHCATPHMIPAKDASISWLNTPVDVFTRYRQASSKDAV